MTHETSRQVQDALSKNRTEELGNDVWQHFVVPPFYGELDLDRATKPRVVVGGRGCGKTMLLRYLSHDSTFSRNRPPMAGKAIEHIGLYWRADTQFARLMNGRGLDEEVWIAACYHLLSLAIGIELLASIENIGRSSIDAISSTDVDALRFDAIRGFDDTLGGSLFDLRRALTARLYEFESWVPNATQQSQPHFLPGTPLLQAMIRECQRQLPPLADAVIRVYVDEYENLQVTQQRVINTCLKHSELPLIFNLAVKRNGFTTQATLGEEAIADIADYRTFDLEALLKGDFVLFAGEVLALKLELAEGSGPTSLMFLREPDHLSRRKADRYRAETLGRARQLLPKLSHEEMAEGVFENPPLRRKLERRIEVLLRERATTVRASSFVLEAHAQASITCLALLARPRLSPEYVHGQLHRLASGAANDFTGTRGWSHNNFVGCLLGLYESQGSLCPIYGGFDTFCDLARGNLRHFLELCHKSLRKGESQSGPHQEVGTLVGIDTIPPASQAQAARQASTAFLGQVRSAGRYGNRLHAFVLRLGSVFHLAHQRPSQSEPEQCHFAIVGGSRLLDDLEEQFLSEAIKWSILFQEENTKAKAPSVKAMDFEYVLNPIYAPYFHISYRKRHRLDLNVDEFSTLVSGSYDDFSDLLRSFSRRWKVEVDDLAPSLFAHLSES